MTSTSHNFSDSLAVGSLPATKALEQERKRLMVASGGRRASLENKLSLDLFTLTFDDEVNSFPAIGWDSAEESDSDDSVRSLDSWNTFMTKSDSMSSLGKRSRNEGCRRLVRSRKIKSDLSSLALGPTV